MGFKPTGPFNPQWDSLLTDVEKEFIEKSGVKTDVVLLCLSADEVKSRVEVMTDFKRRIDNGKKEKSLNSH